MKTKLKITILITMLFFVSSATSILNAKEITKDLDEKNNEKVMSVIPMTSDVLDSLNSQKNILDDPVGTVHVRFFGWIHTWWTEEGPPGEPDWCNFHAKFVHSIWRVKLDIFPYIVFLPYPIHNEYYSIPITFVKKIIPIPNANQDYYIIADGIVYDNWP